MRKLPNQATAYTGSRATLYANGQAVATNRSASLYDNGRAYFGTDILGSVRSATDDYATLEDRYEYDIFGTPYEGDFTSGLNNGYTGKPYDSVTGLYNYGYRDYSPQQARFTTVDPIRDGNNWFSYVVNDPVNYVDLWGLCKTSSDQRKDLATSGTQNPYEGIEPDVSDEILNYMFATEMRELVGVPYKSGGFTTAGTDCSGSIILALENMTGLTLPDNTAAGMAAGNAPYISVSDSVEPANQGNTGIINFYTWDEADGVEHTNVGVGQRGSETINQVVDATDGVWMVRLRSNNPAQSITPAEDSVNQTFVPYQYTTNPSSQGEINWNYIKERIWQ